jgi:hypothetical protein
MADNTKLIQGDPPEYTVKGCESFPLSRQSDMRTIPEDAWRTMALPTGSADRKAALLRDAVVLSGETLSGKSLGVNTLVK